MYEDELDRMCVERCLRGEAEAFEGIVERYEKPVYNAILRLGADQEEARDLCQQVFLKIYEKLGTYDPARRFFSWLYRIAINETLNYIQARRKWEPLDSHMPDPRPDAEQQIEEAERDSELQRALLALDVKYRLAVIVRHFLNLSYGEMAHVLDLPEKTVKSRLFTARQQLRGILEERRHATR